MLTSNPSLSELCVPQSLAKDVGLFTRGSKISDLAVAERIIEPLLWAMLEDQKRTY